jgi:hypothetical protein
MERPSYGDAVVVTSAAPLPAASARPIPGGWSLFNAASRLQCTSGFSVRGTRTKRGRTRRFYRLLTAGHCGTTGRSFFFDRSRRDSGLSEGVAGAIDRRRSPIRKVQPVFAGRKNDRTCQSGQKTFEVYGTRSCGKLVTKNRCVRVEYENPRRFHRICLLNIADAPAERGDSGGPVYGLGGQAQGSIVAGNQSAIAFHPIGLMTSRLGTNLRVITSARPR